MTDTVSCRQCAWMRVHGASLLCFGEQNGRDIVTGKRDWHTCDVARREEPAGGCGPDGNYFTPKTPGSPVVIGAVAYDPQAATVFCNDCVNAHYTRGPYQSETEWLCHSEQHVSDTGERKWWTCRNARCEGDDLCGPNGKYFMPKTEQ